MIEERSEATLSATEKVAVALLFIVAIAVAVVVVGRLGTEPGDVVGPAEERPVVDSEIARPVPVREAVEVATDWAREWDEDAWPILVSAQFAYPLNREQATPAADEGMVMVTFAAPRVGDEWPRLTLVVGRQSGAIYHEDELTSEVEPPESIGDLVAELPITAEQAFSIAQQIVGEDYRAGCAPSRRQVQVVLDTTDNREAPRWVVIYYDERDRGTNDIVVRIDAESGATETEVRDDTSC